MIEKDMKDIESLSFEEAIDELESIVSQLEQDSLTLEKAMELYKRGVLLSQHCTQKIEKAQGDIRMLTMGQNGEARELPFNILEEGNEEDDEDEF